MKLLEVHLKIHSKQKGIDPMDRTMNSNGKEVFHIGFSSVFPEILSNAAFQLIGTERIAAEQCTHQISWRTLSTFMFRFDNEYSHSINNLQNIRRTFDSSSHSHNKRIVSTSQIFSSNFCYVIHKNVWFSVVCFSDFLS